jgi:membrane fusion protein, multidrug efflux system
MHRVRSTLELQNPRLFGGFFLIVTALILLISGGCTQNGDAVTDQPDADPAAGDSASTVSAMAPDSTDVVAEDEKGNFISNLFNRNEEKEKEVETVPVELSPVITTDLPAYLGTTATLEAEKRATVVAKIAGEVRQILQEEGDIVQEGQVLAVLDGAVQRVSLAEAEARLGGIRSNLERAQELMNQQLSSEKVLSDIRYQYDEAAAQVEAMQLQLSYTEIVAPFTGQIAERFSDVGQTVINGAQVFSIVDRDPLLARIHLPEKEAMKIRAGQTVVISPDTHPDAEIHGSVQRIAPVVDPRTGTVKVTCSVSGADQLLRPGSFVRVQVQTDMHSGVLAIPKRALVPEGGEVYVYKAQADSVVKVPVTLGLTNHTFVEVVDGLVNGEQIVTVGHGALKTGSKIRVISAELEPEPVVADSSN